MPGLLSLCEKYFEKTNLYDVLGIDKTATDKQVRKAYHKLSLLVHPDRVDEDKKSEATEKFKVLGKVHSILSDKEKRAVYDETGTFDEENGLFSDSDFDWMTYWKSVFKPISKEEITNYEKTYKGSDVEAMDLKKAYVNGKGDMDFILETVPFTNCSEEPRLREIIQKFIDNNEVPVFDYFINESPRKAARRKRRWEKEAEEIARASAIHDLDDTTGEETLKLLIEKRQRDRGEQMNSFFDQLAAKYGGGGSTKKKTPKSNNKRKRN